MITNKQITAFNKYKSKIKICKAAIFFLTKSIFLSFIILLISCIQSFGQLAALQKVPATVSAGSSFTVKLSINRGSINGFMKLSQSLPEGYSAVEIESKSGDFRYENNETKIIWLKAPSEVSYTVTYKVSVPKNATGSITLGGKIIYVNNNNERKIFNLPIKKVTITAPKDGSKTDKIETAKKTSSNVTNTKETTNAKNTKLLTAKTAKTVAVSSESATAKPSATKMRYGYRKGGYEPDPLNEIEIYSHEGGKNYKVQIGAFRQNHQLSNVPEYSTLVVNGITKHFSGSFSTYEKAAERKKLMIEKGFKDAFIVSFTTNSESTKTHICKSWWSCH